MEKLKDLTQFQVRVNSDDHFSTIFLLLFFRFPNDRPSVTQLQNHVFFKQCKHTSLAEQLGATGIDKYNCTKTTGSYLFLIFEIDRCEILL